MPISTEKIKKESDPRILYHYVEDDHKFISEGDKFRIARGIFKGCKILTCARIVITAEKVLIYYNWEGSEFPINAIECQKVIHQKKVTTKPKQIRIMKKILFLFAAVSLFAGCKDTEIQSTNTMTEKATVVTLIYSPSQHNTELTQTAFSQGDMIGTDYDGNTGIRVGKNLQITSTTIPEKFGVVFQCQHGTFTIEGSDTKHQVLYQKLQNNVGDTVNVLYKEQFLVTFEKDKDGQRKEISRVLNKLDFIDAQAGK